MIKHEVECKGSRLLGAAGTDSLQEPITRTLYQLACSWTHDAQQAKTLVSLVMREHEQYAVAECDGDELRLYARLFRHWCLDAEDCFQPSTEQKPAGSLLSDAAFLQHCVSGLPKYQRVVLTLVDIADLSYRQVSCIINADEQKIRSWLTDARMTILQQKHLRACS
jgi:hypothetical protein